MTTNHVHQWVSFIETCSGCGKLRAAIPGADGPRLPRVALVNFVQDYIRTHGPSSATDIAHGLGGRNRPYISKILQRPHFQVWKKVGKSVLYALAP